MLLLCWIDHFLDSRAEICQIFHCFFGKSMTPKRHPKINWPLGEGRTRGFRVYYTNQRCSVWGIRGGEIWRNLGSQTGPNPTTCWRPYRCEYTGSLQNSEVNHCRARIVLGWGTAREVLRVLLAFWKSRNRFLCLPPSFWYEHFSKGGRLISKNWK